MALKKAEDLQNGVSAEYWKITAMHVDFSHKTATIMLAGFKDQATRAALKQPLKLDGKVLEGDAFPFSPATTALTPLAIAYDAIKKLPEFTGSVDC